MALASAPNKRLLFESRKRLLKDPIGLTQHKRDKVKMQESLSENAEANPASGQLLLKVLIPGYAAGSVIGKKGQIIVQLQKDSGAVIRLSKAKVFYPGTQDRVVIIEGTFEAILKVHCSIVERVYDFPVPKDLAAMIGDRPKQVKIIVPNTTAGLVIGKSGATVKTIMDESGTKIQLTQKSEGSDLQERVITIKGNKQQLLKASLMLLDKIKDDPLCASFPNLGYTYLGGLAASASLSESQLTRSTTTSLNRSQPAVQTLLEPYIIPNQHSFIQSQLQSSHYLSSQYSTVPFSSGNLSVLSNGLNTVAASPYALHQSALVPSVQPSVYAGTTPPVGVLPATSFSRTFNGITAPSLVPTTVAHENGAMFQTNHLIMLSSNQAAGLMSPGYLTPSHQIFNASQGEESRENPVLSEIRLIASPTVSTPSTQPIAGLSNSVTPQSAVKILNTKKSLDGQFETLELAIPEAFIGAVLGKAGRTLIEFQDISGAKIRISKKGEYIVGSRNRKVTITGKPPCPQTAYMLLSKKVANAQELRLQSNLF